MHVLNYGKIYPFEEGLKQLAIWLSQKDHQPTCNQQNIIRKTNGNNRFYKLNLVYFFVNQQSLRPDIYVYTKDIN